MTSLRTQRTSTGTGGVPSSGAPASGASAVAPPASRAQSPGWRDPRVVVGVVIVAVCVLLGARVLGSADDTVAVWSVRGDVPSGSTLHRGDLVAVQVRFTGDVAERYLSATSDIAPGSRVTHDLAAGELVPSAAVVVGGGAELVEVPLSVVLDDLPASVRQGAVVDVWVTPKVAQAGETRARARLALDDVVVVAVPAAGDSLAPRTTQQVIVGVEEGRAGDLADALGQMADGRIVLTRQSRS